ncbi:MAG TPA: aldehyde dehydrogenase family protein, partial [Rhodocyclaceae bacterium]|nr:aldehyde dehydrogenase family protein [Rhodocyclaceae bacterium]
MNRSPALIDNPVRMAEVFTLARSASRNGPTADAATRITRLNKLERLLRDHLGEWETAIAADFGHRSPHETRLEAYSSLEGLAYSRRHLKRWMRPQRRPVALTYLPGRAEVRIQPLGVVGIIVPWNYPIFLSFGPIIDALAAGNRVLVKMSEYSEQAAALFANIAARHFDPAELSIIGGDVSVAEAFSRLPFDHLFFTGSGAVGRRVMHAAAEHLTPVTLELGGKSPLLIAPDYPVEHAAQRIVAGKCLNAGQTCVAPDYVLTPKGSEGALIAALRERIARIYPDLLHNPDYSSIVNVRQYDRLVAYIEDARAQGAEIIELCPGQSPDRESRRLPPLAILNAHQEMRLMQEEIFGPLLPIL